jgi:hypothetical protein
MARQTKAASELEQMILAARPDGLPAGFAGQRDPRGRQISPRDTLRCLEAAATDGIGVAFDYRVKTWQKKPAGVNRRAFA